MKRYRWFLLASGLALILGLQYRTLVDFVGRVSLGRGDVEPLFVVRVAAVKKASLPSEIIASGELEAVREEQAIAQVSGYVDQLRFKTGDSVAAGQVVAAFKIGEAPQRTAQIESALRDFQAQLREKDNRLEEAEKQLEKLRDLRSRNLIATKDLTGAEAMVDAARAEKELVKAQFDQQQATLAQLRYTLKLLNVTAPLGGVVTETFVEPGGFVQNGWPILTVAAPDPLKVVIKVSEKDAALLRPGSSATIAPNDKPDRVVIGKVTGLDHSRAAKEAVVLVEIQLPNRQRQLVLGTAVSVVIKLAGQREALLIPRQAIVEAEGQSMVYVVVNDRAQALQVATRPYRAGMIEVMMGLDENQQVVVDDPSRLKPNSKIRVDTKTPQR